MKTGAITYSFSCLESLGENKSVIKKKRCPTSSDYNHPLDTIWIAYLIGIASIYRLECKDTQSAKWVLMGNKKI